jgi:hypothetical protein
MSGAGQRRPSPARRQLEPPELLNHDTAGNPGLDSWHIGSSLHSQNVSTTIRCAPDLKAAWEWTPPRPCHHTVWPFAMVCFHLGKKPFPRCTHKCLLCFPCKTKWQTLSSKILNFIGDHMQIFTCDLMRAAQSFHARTELPPNLQPNGWTGALPPQPVLKGKGLEAPLASFILPSAAFQSFKNKVFFLLNVFDTDKFVHHRGYFTRSL